MTAVPSLIRPVRDMVAHRIARSRGSQWGPHLQWQTGLPLRDAVAFDSLDLVDAAEGVVRLFGLDEVGWEDVLLMQPSLAGWAGIANAALEEHGALRFSSSGSQGEPVEHRHGLATLQQEAGQIERLIGSRRRVVCSVPTHHIYGFIFGVLLPQRLGCEVLDTCGLPPTSVAGKLRSGDLLVAHPRLWSSLSELAMEWPVDLIGTTSTAPMELGVAGRLRAQGLARLVEVYGSSETAGIGWRDDSDAAFELFPQWCKADGQSLHAEDGRQIALPDRCEVDSRMIRPLGRHDRAVQVAGHNVYPDRIADVLQQAPGVRTAQVRLDARSGRLKALVSMAPGATPCENALRVWCSVRLSTAERPARFTFADPQRHGDVLGKGADW